MKTEKIQRIWDAIKAAIDGGTVKALKESEIFICGPNSHNEIPGAYEASRTGMVCPYLEVAIRENRRGWIPRLRAKLAEFGLSDAKVVVKFDPVSCWVQGVGPTAQVVIDHPSFHDGWNPILLISCLPVASEKAAGIQKTLPVGWVAEPTWRG